MSCPTGRCRRHAKCGPCVDAALRELLDTVGFPAGYERIFSGEAALGPGAAK